MVAGDGYFKHQKLCHASIVGACSPPFRFDEVIFRKYDKKQKRKSPWQKVKKKVIEITEEGIIIIDDLVADFQYLYDKIKTEYLHNSNK